MIYLFLLISTVPSAHSDCDSENGVCKTKLCNVLAESIMNHVNMSESPYVDPVGFYCSNHSNEFLDVSNRSEIIHNVLEEEYNGSRIMAAVPKLYRSCAKSNKDIEFHKQVELFIAEIGGCPLLNKTWSKTDYNLEKAVGILMAKHGINTFFSLDIYGINDIRIGQHSENLKALDNKTRFHRLFQSFSDQVIPSDELDRTMSELRYFQESINNEWTGPRERSWPTHSVKVKDFRLNQNMSPFNWTTLFDTILDEAGVPVSNDSNVSERYKGYSFNGLPKFVRSFPKRIIANFLVWKLLDTYNMDTFFKDEPFFEFQDRMSLSEKCLNYVALRFYNIVGKLVIDKTVTTTMREDLNKITQIAKTAVNGYIDKLHWMDNETKLKAHGKIQKIRVIVAFDQHNEDSKSIIEAFEKQYSALKMITGHNFAKDMSLYNLGKFKEKFSQTNELLDEYGQLMMDSISNDIFISSVDIFYPRYLKNGPFVFNVAAFGSFLVVKLFDKIKSNANEIYTLQTLEKYENLKRNTDTNSNDDEEIFEAKLEAGLFPELFKAFEAYVNKNGKLESIVRLPGLLTNYSISTDFLLSYTNLKCLSYGPDSWDKVTPIVVKEYAYDMLNRC